MKKRSASPAAATPRRDRRSRSRNRRENLPPPPPRRDFEEDIEEDFEEEEFVSRRRAQKFQKGGSSDSPNSSYLKSLVFETKPDKKNRDIEAVIAAATAVTAGDNNDGTPQFPPEMYLSPEELAVIDSLKKKEEAAVGGGRATPAPVVLPPPPPPPAFDMSPVGAVVGVVPRQHQLRIVDFLSKPENRGIVAAFSTGTGKTLTAVLTAICLLHNKIVKRVVVVTPKSLVENFQKEMESSYGSTKFAKFFNKFEFYTTQGFVSELQETETRKLCDDTLLIIDEAHNFIQKIPKAVLIDRRSGKPAQKSVTIPRSYYAVNCAIRATKVLLLTATPEVNSPADALNLAAMVKGEPPLDELPRNPIEIMKYFENVFSFFDNGDAAARGMPTVTEVRNIIRMSPEYYAEYYTVQNSQRVDYADPLVFLQGVRKATNDLPNNPKISWVMDRVSSPAERKTVIYSAFIDSGIGLIKSGLKSRGIKYVEITGDKTQAERTQAVTDYNSDKVRVLLISRAGAEGLDLKGTRDVILLESSWNESQEKQVIGRAARFGSHSHLPEKDRTVEIFHMILAKPIIKYKGDEMLSADERMQQIVQEKAEKIPRFTELIKRVSVS